MVSAGKKRASPGAEEEKNPFEVDISEEVHEKLQKVSKEIARVELSLGLWTVCFFLPSRANAHWRTVFRTPGPEETC